MEDLVELTTMLDIQFLDKPFTPDMPVIYIYETGCLKREVLDCFDQLALENNIELASSSPGHFLDQGFFDYLNVCEWPDTHPESGERTIRLLCRRDKSRGIIFTRRQSALVRHTGWPEVAQNCLILEERAIGIADLSVALRVLAHRCAFAPGLSLEDPDFRAHYEQLLAEAPLKWTELVDEFEHDVFAHYDPEKQSFHRSASESHTSATSKIFLVRDLRRVIKAPADEKRRISLLRTLERRFAAARDRDAALAETFLALDRTLTWASKQPPNSCRQAITLATNIMCEEDAILERASRSSGAERPDQVVTVFDCILRSWSRQSMVEFAAFDDEGRWLHLDRLESRLWASAANALSISRHVLAQRLHELLQNMKWIAGDPLSTLYNSLGRGLDTSKHASNASLSREHESEFSYESFEEICGRPALIEALKSKIGANQKQGAMIICGPANSDKRAIARLFAKAVLCFSPLPDPCDRCQSCVAFGKTGAGGTLGYAEYVGGRGLDHAGAAALIQFGDRSTLADNNVLLVDSAEAMDKTAADKMLRDLERPATTTMTVLLADNVGQLPPALLSRCEKWRADMLDIFQSRRFVDDLCARESLNVSPALQRFVAIAGGGSPSKIRETLLHLDRQQSSTVEEAKAAFGLTWVDMMTQYWLNVLDAHTAVQWTPFPDEHKRLQVYLNYLFDLFASGGHAFRPSDEPAISVADHEMSASLIAKLTQCGRDGHGLAHEKWKRWLSYSLGDCAADFPCFVDFAMSV